MGAALLTTAMLVAASASTALAAGAREGEDARPGYRLVWADEFNAPGRPDPKKWTYERGFVRNNELQWYRPENAVCRDGLLVIEGRRERLPNPNHEPGSSNWKRKRPHIEYTSSSLTTRGLHGWCYGRFEMRGRIDTRAGLWPAFWTVGVEGEWPSNGEIDIMEFYRGKLLANAAWGTKRRWKPKWDSSRKPVADFKDPDWAKKFHVWRMDWDRNEIRLSVDGTVLNTVDVRKTVNAGDGKNPFRHPHLIILNLAIGGNAGGDPSKTKFPARFEVDYVRVYQKR
jgi:beta-glucanase (GH16 family)